MTTKHICWQPLRNQTSLVDRSVGLLWGGGGEKQKKKENTEGRKNGQQIECWKTDGREGRQGESNERRNREEAKDRERMDSQSMKQFDNLVILLLKSIRPERPAIKLDAQWQRNKEAGTLDKHTQTLSLSLSLTHTHTHTHYSNKRRHETNNGKSTQIKTWNTQAVFCMYFEYTVCFTLGYSKS